MKKILKNSLIASFVVAAFMAVGVFSSTASAQGSGIFCDPPHQNTEVPIETGVTKAAFCKGLDAGNNPVCKDGTIIPLDAGISEADFCAGEHGGVANSVTGTTAGNGNETSSSACSVAQNGPNASKGCVIPIAADNVEGKYQCGKGDKAVKVTFNIGCRGEANEADTNPIWDMLYALMRFLIAGVGIVTIGSVVYGGILYIASQGNPQTTQTAIKRIQASVGALLLYIFAFALLNWIIPGGIIQ